MNPPAAPNSGGSTAMTMKKGTTTLGFVYKVRILLAVSRPGMCACVSGSSSVRDLGISLQGGIIIAVDSRASMGTFISSQTVCKVLEISDVILGESGCL